MANPEQLEILSKGVNVWNKWKNENPQSSIDLSAADLQGAFLKGVNFHQANLEGANFSKANLSESNLTKSNLKGVNFKGANLAVSNLKEARLNKANFREAYLYKADLKYTTGLSEAIFYRTNLRKAGFEKANLNGANLREADLYMAYLNGADLRGADLYKADITLAQLVRADLTNAYLVSANLEEACLRETIFLNSNLSDANLRKAELNSAVLEGANLTGANLIGTNLENAKLGGATVYGISAWDLNLKNTQQDNLIITRKGQPEITVDNLEVAQFIYLLLNNKKIREVIDTITSKSVLILGRFTSSRKTVLDSMKEACRNTDLLPILFDFQPSENLDITETVRLLANMAKFVIADITDARSIPQELSHIIPDLPSVPIQPIVLSSQREYAMFPHWKRYPWVLETFEYDDVEHLLKNLDERIIKPPGDYRKNKL